MLKEKNANKYIYSNYFGFWNPLKSEPPYSVGDLELYDNIFQIWVIYFLFFFFFHCSLEKGRRLIVGRIFVSYIVTFLKDRS